VRELRARNVQADLLRRNCDSRTIDFPAFAEIANEVGAILVADIAHIAG